MLALGCNDLKSRHGCGPDDITSGLAALIADVRKVGACCAYASERIEGGGIVALIDLTKRHGIV